MDVKEIIIKKSQLEKEIAGLVDEFLKETGVTLDPVILINYPRKVCEPTSVTLKVIIMN
jgi:hypothetical protein